MPSISSGAKHRSAGALQGATLAAMAEASPTKSSMEPLILRPRKGQWVINSTILGALFLACAVTTAIQSSTHEALGWIMLDLLGALSTWSIWFAFSKRARLELTRDGFKFYTPTATGAYRWSGIEAIAHGTMNRRDAVFFKFAPHDNGKKPPLHQLAGALSKGFEVALPELVGDWHARALPRG